MLLAERPEDVLGPPRPPAAPALHAARVQHGGDDLTGAVLLASGAERLELGELLPLGELVASEGALELGDGAPSEGEGEPEEEAPVAVGAEPFPASSRDSFPRPEMSTATSESRSSTSGFRSRSAA